MHVVPQLIAPGDPAVEVIVPEPVPADPTVRLSWSIPVPLRLRMGWLSGVALAVIVPERGPYAPGPNATLMKHDELAATGVPLQLSAVMWKSAGFEPPGASVTLPLLALPSLRSVNVLPLPAAMT